MSKTFLIYGANGYTGELVAKEAVAQGLTPVLAGRSAEAVAALAQRLGLDHRVFSLDDPAAVTAGLDGMGAVLHCAGPFWHTAVPMLDGCLRTGTHYLDVTGEIAVFQLLAARSDEAKAAGIMVLPGAGFDVVPTDCLAAHLKRRLPTANHLVLAFKGLGGVSRGAMTTAVEAIARGQAGMIRRNGELAEVPSGWRTSLVDFGQGSEPTVTIPWGDVYTGYHSTGIPNIEVYMAASQEMIRNMALGRYVTWLMKSSMVQNFVKKRIRSGKPGPTPEERARGRSYIWGMAEDSKIAVQSRLVTPEGYTLTALTGVHMVQKALADNAPPGYQTPSSAYGPDLIMEIKGVTREELKTLERKDMGQPADDVMEDAG